ncbi:MAG: type II toxin-antitoxin system prevent-host-death family antitoxin [Acidimicrobiia bacterium]|nr:type II toxin-antitoxin system prevent-host-death family antitoxin [Acidimicrobiia bacterium]
MNIGIRELKQNLSKYIEKVANGELVVVTDRGVAKAMIVPVPGGDQMAVGVEEGWITPAKKTGRLSRPLNLHGSMRSIDAINEDRGS